MVRRRTRPKVNRPLVYDWMRGATIAAALCCLQFLEMSRVYHYIRGQAMVKLYVLIAMVEIFDKASRGADGPADKFHCRLCEKATTAARRVASCGDPG